MIQRAKPYTCALHPSVQISYFCQSCKDLVCETCIVKQPHSGKNHTIKVLSQAADIRKKLYNQYIDQEVNLIRSNSQNKINNIHNLKKQIERDKKVIEKDIKIQFQAVNSKLLHNQSLDVIERQTQIKNLQNYIQTFDDLSNAFECIYQNPQAVLLSYKNLQTQIKKLQFLMASLLSQEAKIKNNKVERQFQKTLSKCQALSQYQDRNSFMNKLIIDYIKIYKKQLANAKQNNIKKGKQIEHTYNNTFHRVVADQIAKICVFCKSVFTVDNANQPCKDNRSYKSTAIYSEIDQKLLPKDVKGSTRHFWYRCEPAHRKKPSLKQHNLIRKTSKKYYWNALLELEVVKHILKKQQIQKGSKFHSVISSNDPQKTGFVSKVAFVYVLTKVYMIPKQIVQSMVDMMTTQKGIDYQKFIQKLKNPTQDFFSFTTQEQKIQKQKPIAPESISRYRY